MTQTALASAGQAAPLKEGLPGVVADWSSDQRAFKNVPWGKAMMWIFLLSDTFIFGSFLISYMTVRMSTQAPWPNPSEVFALVIAGQSIPLILIAIMTFVLISSSGTMVLAGQLRVSQGPQDDVHLPDPHRDPGRDVRRDAGVRVEQADLRGGNTPVGQPDGRGAVRRDVLHDHRLSRHARVDRRDLLIIVAVKVLRGSLDAERPGFLTGRRGNYEMVETMGLYWHFVDLVWVFIFAVFYLW
jgi:cytochrome c oxidase subunit 3